MSDQMRTASAVTDRLRGLATEPDLATLTKRLPSGELALGVRVRDLFATAKAAVDLPQAELDRLFSHDAFEPRTAAFCILDARARNEPQPTLRQPYLDHHDAITTWDMVDRAASRRLVQSTLTCGTLRSWRQVGW